MGSILVTYRTVKTELRIPFEQAIAGVGFDCGEADDIRGSGRILETTGSTIESDGEEEQERDFRISGGDDITLVGGIEFVAVGSAESELTGPRDPLGQERRGEGKEMLGVEGAFSHVGGISLARDDSGEHKIRIQRGIEKLG